MIKRHLAGIFLVFLSRAGGISFQNETGFMLSSSRARSPPQLFAESSCSTRLLYTHQPEHSCRRQLFHVRWRRPLLPNSPVSCPVPSTRPPCSFMYPIRMHTHEHSGAARQGLSCTRHARTVTTSYRGAFVDRERAHIKVVSSMPKCRAPCAWRPGSCQQFFKHLVRPLDEG